ncbi:MAG: ABC transporter substrate-binding protein [Chloroflexus sp.]|nr:ABC transporter substrate-binding protein [Chloroflexus sp.]MBO9334837.1 ABC transporter substrate-binding protein [Roseiflexus sp.]MBO9390352.1 ABC transporter substrate-binding protein [Roseiflexus sp.]
MKTRVSATLVLSLILALLLSACASPAAAPATPTIGTPSTPTTGTSSAPTIELLYMTHNHAPSIPVNEAIIAEFEATHPNVKIIFDNAPHANFEQKVLTAFAGGQGPDVFWAGDWMVPQFLDSGIIAPVDPTAFGVATQDEFEALFEPGSLDAFKANGKIYTGGISEYNTFSLIYNVDALKEAGIKPLPKDRPITWEELADIATRLTVKEGDVIKRVGLSWPFNVPIWTVLIQEPMLRQKGGELITPEGMPDFTQEPMVAVMTYLQKLRQADAIDPATYTDLLQDFANERSAMIFGGPWAVAPLKTMNPNLNWDIAPLPQFANAKERVTTLYAWAWFVSAKSSPEKQKAAWEFVNLLTSKQKEWWEKVGYVQARKTEIDGKPLREYYIQTDPRLATIFADYAYGKFEFRSTKYFELSDIWTRAQNRILTGEDVMSVLRDAQAQAKAAMTD